MSRAKRQHFVPRFYLKNFAHSSSSLFSYDKTNDSVVETNVNDIALGKNFYELEGLENGLIEKSLSKNENKFSNAYHELIEEKEISKLSQESVTHFFFFMALQILRTLNHRLDLQNALSKAYDKMFSQIANDFLKKKGSRLAGHVRVSPDPEEAKLMQIEMIIETVPLFARILAAKRWWINENFHDVPFWTSDSPVVLYNEVNRELRMGNLGLLSPGIEIHFPLTKDLRLVSYDLNTHLFKRNMLGRFERMHVIWENTLQLMDSSRFVYAPSDNDFERAKKFLSDYPQFRNRMQRMNVY
ncbi:MAG TPA: DUF4238 domain-containing protein [Nitrososphaeraceae archaeon]|nr:DUF4238 domain-containing protein [Nitrososphaeraceae archaeon]